MPGAVVGRGGDDPGHGGAVAVRIGRAGGAVEDRRAGDELAVEVGVRGVDAGVEDGDDRGAGRVDRAVDGVQPIVAQRPLVVDARVVRERLGLAEAVGLDAGDRRVGAQVGDDRGPGRDSDDVHAKRGDRVDDTSAPAVARASARAEAGRAVGEGDDVRRRRAGRGRRGGDGLGGGLDRGLRGGLDDGLGRWINDGLGRGVGCRGGIGRGGGIRGRRGVGRCRRIRLRRGGGIRGRRRVGFGSRIGRSPRAPSARESPPGPPDRLPPRESARTATPAGASSGRRPGGEAPRSGTSSRTCAPEIPRLSGPARPPARTTTRRTAAVRAAASEVRDQQLRSGRAKG